MVRSPKLWNKLIFGVVSKVLPSCKDYKKRMEKSNKFPWLAELPNEVEMLV